MFTLALRRQLRETATHVVILPHEQSRRLYNALPALDPDFVDRVNAGVRRAPGWETTVG